MKDYLKRNMANILTTSRFIAAFFLFFFIKNEKGFLILYSICWFTDFIDGTIARVTKTQSDFGSRMDDIADYTLIIIMISIMIIWIQKLVFPYLPLLFLMIAIRVANGFITKKKFGKTYIIHTYMNKLTAFTAFLLPIFYIQFNFLPFAYIVLSIGVLASFEETMIHLRSNVYNSERKSIFSKQAN